jgi:NAD+ kinase
MIRKVFVLANKKIKGIDKEKERIERLLKRCGKDVQNSPEDVDLIVTMGGDGTFLKGVHLIKNLQTFVYGIKYGNVGFLANGVKDIESKLKKVVDGNFKVQKRMLLDVIIKKGSGTVRDVCLNEVVAFRKGIRIIEVTAAGSRETIFSRLRGDGLIISTPTGSTAHSLSAGGPVIAPDMECLLILPVCPHTVSWRPVIVPPDEKIMLSVSPEAVLAVDGQREFEIGASDSITVKKSAKSVKIIMDDSVFFRKLESKFNWGA